MSILLLIFVYFLRKVQCHVMSEKTVKLQLFFDYCEIRKSKHSRSYVNLFMMSSNQKEQNLDR
jgi:hypothetical protein